MSQPASIAALRRRLPVALVLTLLAAGGAARAQMERQEAPPAAPEDDPIEARPAREWLPEGTLYEPYIAEIRRPGFAAGVLGAADVGAEGSGDQRFHLKLGGSFGLLRLAPAGSGRLWQLSLEAGFYGQFDIDHSLDNLGWDGLYGLTLATARAGGRGPALELAVNHISSHVGDEYAERTGRRRIGYTREEVALGASWRPDRCRWRRWRVYGEAAWAHVTRNEELQDPGRVEAGIEYEAPGSVGRSGRWGTYAALDVNGWEERDWQPSVGLAAGFRATSGDRIWRLGLLAYDGQLPIGELFQVDERYVIAGAWLDLERGLR
jgi:hypothetical protein